MERRLFTSESVTEGHPDKICDQISDAILDALMEQDPMSRVACETCTTTGLVMVMGEITTKASIDIQKIVRDTIREIGYTRAKFGFDADTCGVIYWRWTSSPPILPWAWTRRWKQKSSKMSDERDRGHRRRRPGYDVRLMPPTRRRSICPIPSAWPTSWQDSLTEVRKNGTLTYLRPDGKTQVTVEYDENDKPVPSGCSGTFHPARSRM